MDILKKIAAFVSKYRYVVLVLVIGIILMLLPTSAKETQSQTTVIEEQREDLAQKLAQILSSMDGVGEVQVLLTEAEGEMNVYQYDENSGGFTTVIITDANRAQYGLIKQVNPAQYRGAIVVCQGADSALVRLNIIEAVSKVTGLSSDRISVLKMN